MPPFLLLLSYLPELFYIAYIFIRYLILLFYLLFNSAYFFQLYLNCIWSYDWCELPIEVARKTKINKADDLLFFFLIGGIYIAAPEASRTDPNCRKAGLSVLHCCAFNNYFKKSFMLSYVILFLPLIFLWYLRNRDWTLWIKK